MGKKRVKIAILFAYSKNFPYLCVTNAKERKNVMPIIIPITVDIPPTKTVSFEHLRDEITRYAQNVVDSEENIEVMSETELMSHAMTVDEVRQDMHAWVHEHFQTVHA